MKVWRKIAKFTLWYWLVLSITGIANYMAFGNIAPDNMTTDILNLISFSAAAGFVSRSNGDPKDGLENKKHSAYILTGWTFFLPWVELAFLVLFLFLVGAGDLSQAILARWTDASPLTVLSMTFGQAVDAIVVFMIVWRSLAVRAPAGVDTLT
jgi:hypothetical protein